MQQLNPPAHPQIEMQSPINPVPYANNARTHSKEQIQQIARSIERFGFTNPVLIDDEDGIIAGHGRVEAAKVLGLNEVPTICLSHLSDADRLAYILADNKLAENAGWDEELLAIELQGLIELDFEIADIGFSTTELDILLDGPQGKGAKELDDRLDAVPALKDAESVTRRSDPWLMGDHRLLCGDARSRDDVGRLCADM